MKTPANQTIGKIPTYACPAAQLASLFGMAESTIHLYAAEGKLPRLAYDRFDAIWLLYLSVGQNKLAGMQASLSVTATVAYGWIEFLGDDLDSSEDRDAFIAVFERNGFTRDDFYVAIDEVMAFFDEREVFYNAKVAIYNAQVASYDEQIAFHEAQAAICRAEIACILHDLNQNPHV